jgi:hypothetical protein
VPPKAGDAVSLQIACVGDRLAVWVQERLIGVIDDTTLPGAANIGVQAVDGHIQTFEYLDIDDLSESAARKLFGIEYP